MRFLGMRHIALRVRDVERSARFYERAFGMRRFGPAKSGGTFVPLVSPNLEDQISLSSEPESGETERTLGHPGEQGGIDHFGFIVSPGTRLEAVQEHLVACGATFLRRVDIDRRVPTLFFADPDGYVFQVSRFPRFTRLFIALLPLLNALRSRRRPQIATRH
ncbi:VOC family protein [Archangium violaceum]|uniref:VOC family protein n=1 Tax=Archangium violaceum TaxID=83451 RepID=UPI00193BF676|nr:VOC family protein [Archangium violaceum]QRK06234.1 VOC family protein [Archangium violaceum]